MGKNPIRPLATHLGAVVLGAAMAFVLKRESAVGTPDLTGHPAGKRPRETTVLSAEELIGALKQDPEAQEAKPDEPDAFSRYKALSRSLAPAANPGAAYQDLLKEAESAGIESWQEPLSEAQLELLATLGVRFNQWFLQDPKAALASLDLENPGSQIAAGYFSSTIFSDALRAQGVRAFLARIDGAPFKHWVLFSDIAREVGEKSSAEDLKWLVDQHPELASNKYFQASGDTLGGKWSIEDRDALPTLLKGDLCAGSMLALAKRMEGKSGLDWIQSWIDSGKLDEKTVKELADSAARLVNKRDIPLEEQVAVIRQLGSRQGANDKQLKSQMITGQIHEFLQSDGDWLYGFQQGVVSAREVLDAALAAAPDPGAAKDEFRSQIFRHLAEDDLGSAMTLLDGMSENDKDWQKIYASRWWFEGVDPDQFYETVSTISYEGDAAKADSVRQAWLDKSANNLQRFGEDYLAWVKSLPDGQNKTWALEGLENASKSDYPWIAAEVNQLLEGKP